MFTNILKEPAATILRVEKEALCGKQWYRYMERITGMGVLSLFGVYTEEESE
jgi:hypothetical protein